LHRIYYICVYVCVCAFWYIYNIFEKIIDLEHCKFFLNFNQKWPDYIFKILHLNYLLILNWKWPDYIDLASTSNLLYNLWSFQKCYKYIKKHTHIHTHKYSIFYSLGLSPPLTLRVIDIRLNSTLDKSLFSVPVNKVNRNHVKTGILKLVMFSINR
jgi:hypothetical protein